MLRVWYLSTPTVEAKENYGNLSHHALQTGALHILRTNRSHVMDIIFPVKLIKNYLAKEYRVHVPNMIKD